MKCDEFWIYNHHHERHKFASFLTLTICNTTGQCVTEDLNLLITSLSTK